MVIDRELREEPRKSRILKVCARELAKFNLNLQVILVIWTPPPKKWNRRIIERKEGKRGTTEKTPLQYSFTLRMSEFIWDVGLRRYYETTRTVEMSIMASRLTIISSYAKAMESSKSLIGIYPIPFFLEKKRKKLSETQIFDSLNETWVWP